MKHILYYDYVYHIPLYSISRLQLNMLVFQHHKLYRNPLGFKRLVRLSDDGGRPPKHAGVD
jgi:hypothetical protein